MHTPVDQGSISRDDQRRHLRMDERGLSDVVGSLLLIALTMGTAVGLALLVSAYEGPREHDSALLSVRRTVDGAVEVSHKGGESVDRDLVEVRVEHNGVLTTYTGAQLGGDWADGELTIGETWTVDLGLQAGDTLSVGVIDARTNEVIASMPLFTVS